MRGIILLRGGGDLASGTALRLFRAGLHLVITELPQPLAVRRTVSFAQVVYSRQIVVEGVTARLALDSDHARRLLGEGVLPVLVDPLAGSRKNLDPVVLIDGRMTKCPSDLGKDSARLVIGLGPGFIAGVDCHAVIETRRGPNLGRVIWDGPAEADTGVPDAVADQQAERVLRSPADGILITHAQIGDHLTAGQVVAEVAGQPVMATFSGVLRGLLMNGLVVAHGLKIGDVDPRDDPRLCHFVSDKSLAVGGGVLEAVLSRPDVRSQIWK
jgi:xanthine dehydrogenase accessory factor